MAEAAQRWDIAAELAKALSLTVQSLYHRFQPRQCIAKEAYAHALRSLGRAEAAAAVTEEAAALRRWLQISLGTVPAESTQEADCRAGVANSSSSATEAGTVVSQGAGVALDVLPSSTDLVVSWREVIPYGSATATIHVPYGVSAARDVTVDVAPNCIRLACRGIEIESEAPFTVDPESAEVVARKDTSDLLLRVSRAGA